MYVDSGGVNTRRDVRSAPRSVTRPEISDFQRLVGANTGEMLPVFGSRLFERAPSTFAPVDQVAASSDYIVGPGDQVLLRMTGAQSLNGELTVDRAGAIYVPQVGSIQVAGLRYDQLQKHLETEIGRYYRNFTLSVNLGQLRSIQIYVVGEAQQPGSYTVGSFSTLLNALFACGGPSNQGSLRRVQLLRKGQTVTEMDLYAFIFGGDESKDAHLEGGDVIVIPPAGPQIALAGSVRRPAIYELRNPTTVGDLLNFAGGLLPVATNRSLSLERLGPDQIRHAMTVMLDPAGRSSKLEDGDILFVNHITAAFEKTVTIRGNLANPGRFAWRPGMRLSDILPDRMSLLTNDYWNQRNRLGEPTPLFDPARTNQMAARTNDRTRVTSQTPRGSNELLGLSGGLPETSTDSLTNGQVENAAAEQALQARANMLAEDTRRRSVATQALQNTRLASGGVSSSSTRDLDPQDPDAPLDPSIVRVQSPAPEIVWSYAVIERLDPETLKSVLVPFNLGKLVMDHDSAQDLELQPGDIVTIFSQADIPVSIEQQTKFVRLEGEVVSAGVYTVYPGETLVDLVRRAGGPTSKAYLYGSSFFRQSARITQQERLDQYLDELSLELARSAAVRSASAITPGADISGAAEQRSIIDQLRSQRATGRIVLEFAPQSTGVSSIPAISLENGDIFRIPPKPNTVSVIGAVYGQNIFLYDPTRKVADYVALAGKPNRIADSKHAFIIRADGSIYSRVLARGTFSNNFDSTGINPGDSIVVPEKLIKPSGTRALLDYTQLFSSLGLTAAALNNLH